MHKIFLILLFFLAVSSELKGQPIRASYDDKGLVVEEHNKLQFPGGTRLSSLFFGKMDALMRFGQGQIRVLHIGGSHIQADIYSNRMRNHLSNFLPNQMSSRGLIFPFTAAKTNNPRNYKVAYTGTWSPVRNVHRTLANPLGLSGISISTLDTLSQLKITFDVPGETPHDFLRIKVLHNTDSLSYGLRWLTDDSVRFEQHEGYTEIIFQSYQREINLGLQKTDSLQQRFEFYGFLLETDRPGFVYNAVGVNGASTWSYLKCEKFEEQLKLTPPDIAFFGIGINDAHDANFSAAAYYANYVKIIEQFKAANPEVLLIFITNNDSYGYNRRLNTKADEVQKVMFDLAKKYEGAVWDLFALMGGSTSSNAWRDAGFMAKDRIHFSGEGYNLIGDLLFNAIMESFESYLIQTFQNQ